MKKTALTMLAVFSLTTTGVAFAGGTVPGAVAPAEGVAVAPAPAPFVAAPAPAVVAAPVYAGIGQGAVVLGALAAVALVAASGGNSSVATTSHH